MNRLWLCCLLYSTFQVLTAQRMGRATHWLCREGMDISSPCFLKLWVSLRNCSGANHCYSTVRLHLMKVAVYNLTELGFRLTSEFAKWFMNNVILSWYCVSLIVWWHLFLFTPFAFDSLKKKVLLCEDKVSVSSSLLSDFSLWQREGICHAKCVRRYGVWSMMVLATVRVLSPSS